MTELTKENLQKFINQYLDSLKELEWFCPEYLDGVKDTLADIESEFLPKDNFQIKHKEDNKPCNSIPIGTQKVGTTFKEALDLAYEIARIKSSSKDLSLEDEELKKNMISKISTVSLDSINF